MKLFKDIFKYKKDIDTVIKIKNSVSHANFYADEVYLTQGTFLHVVFVLQMGYDVKISIDEYMDSFIENFGKIIYEIKVSMNLANYLYNISKYVIRMIDAANHLKHIDKKIHKIGEELKTLFILIQNIKKRGSLKIEEKVSSYIQDHIFKSTLRRSGAFTNLYDEESFDKSKIMGLYNKLYNDYINPILISFPKIKIVNNVEKYFT